jgi:hypothetical protein
VTLLSLSEVVIGVEWGRRNGGGGDEDEDDRQRQNVELELHQRRIKTWHGETISSMIVGFLFRRGLLQDIRIL